MQPILEVVDAAAVLGTAVEVFGEGDFESAFQILQTARQVVPHREWPDTLLAQYRQAVVKEREAIALRLIHLAEVPRHESTTAVVSAAPPAEPPVAVEPPVEVRDPRLAAPSLAPAPERRLSAEQRATLRYMIERAEFHIRLGQYYCAVLALREALELDPHDPKVRDMLEEVRGRLSKTSAPKSDSGPVHVVRYLQSGCQHCGEPETIAGPSTPLEPQASSQAFLPLHYRYLYSPDPFPRAMREPTFLGGGPAVQVPVTERYRQEALLRPEPPRPAPNLREPAPAQPTLRDRYLQMPASVRQPPPEPAVRTTTPAWQRYLLEPPDRPIPSLRDRYLNEPDAATTPSWRAQLLHQPATTTRPAHERYADPVPATPSLRDRYLSTPGPDTATFVSKRYEPQPHTPSVRDRYLSEAGPTTSPSRNRYLDHLPVGPTPRQRYLFEPGPTVASLRDRYAADPAPGPSLKDRYLEGSVPTTTSARNKYLELDNLAASPTLRQIWLESDGPMTRSARARYGDVGPYVPQKDAPPPPPLATELPPNRLADAWRLLPPSDRPTTPLPPSLPPVSQKPTLPDPPPVPAVRER